MAWFAFDATAPSPRQLLALQGWAVLITGDLRVIEFAEICAAMLIGKKRDDKEQIAGLRSSHHQSHLYAPYLISRSVPERCENWDWPGGQKGETELAGWGRFAVCVAESGSN